MEMPTAKDLTPLVEEKIATIREALTRNVVQGRLALGALLDGKRLQVFPDGRIEGHGILSQNELAALKEPSGRRDSVVAGAGFEPAASGL